MKVAWHEVPGKAAIWDPSRRERFDRVHYAPVFPAPGELVSFGRASLNCKPWRQTLHTVPYGTGLAIARVQALRARLPSFSPCGTRTKSLC